MVKFSKFQASLVKLNGSSAVEVLIGKIVSFINQNVKNISPDKIDSSLLRFLCNVVENSYTKKDVIDNKVNKKKVVIDVYNILKPSADNEEDKLLFDKMVEDFHSSKQILKISRLRYYYKLLKNELFSKKAVAFISDSQMHNKAYVPKLGFELKPFSAPEPNSL
jgi:hypothetical protein